MTNTKAHRSKNLPDAEALQENPEYRKILELEFSEMIPFVLTNIRKRGVIPLFYLTINAAFLIFIFIYSLWSIQAGLLSFGRISLQIITGIFAGSILVILPHELLHGLAYRLLGARKIHFGMDLQQFIFYVTADHFPISRRELVFLALTPFVAINALLIAATALWATHFTLFFAALLLSHNIMCIGDFAIISYAFGQKGELYTYDDVKNKRSYFFNREI
jgi:hypothetical protein